MSESSLSRNIIRRLRSDKRRVGALVFLAALGLLMWGRLLLLKPVPRVAVADPAEVARQLAAQQKQKSEPADRILAGNTVYVDLPERMERDLFNFDQETYRTLFAQPVKNDPPEALPEKSPPRPADVSEQAQAAGKGLVLRATILGEQPRAVINGRTMAPGEEINGLTLVEVHQGSVVLRMNGIDIRLDQ